MPSRSQQNVSQCSKLAPRKQRWRGCQALYILKTLCICS
uniref:Uncharacterized protein n=1 Tax=Arundo donax TaxID=35708 RepID=A0A0A9F6Q6_ARUDO